MATVDVVVGRQPIFDKDLFVVGYEILHSDREASASTRQLLFDAVSVGIPRLVGEGMLFCDIDRETALEGMSVVLPPSGTVLELDAGLLVDADLLQSCEALVSQGFRLALDHVREGRIDPDLARLIAIVKVERDAAVRAVVDEVTAATGEPAPAFVVMGVETYEDLERCRDAGFVYFQGGLLSKPQSITGKIPGRSGTARLARAARLAARECSALELHEAIRGEPALVYQLLQLASVGTHHGMRREVTSVREALVLLGWRRVQSWLSFLLATAGGTASEEEVVTTLVRARMCELLAFQLTPENSELAFTAGMVSAFDRMLDIDIDDVLAQVAADGPLRDAVLGADTPVGRIVSDVVTCQQGAAILSRSGVSEVALRAAAVSALGWALEIVRSTSGEPASAASSELRDAMRAMGPRSKED